MMMPSPAAVIATARSVSTREADQSRRRCALPPTLGLPGADPGPDLSRAVVMNHHRRRGTLQPGMPLAGDETGPHIPVRVLGHDVHGLGGDDDAHLEPSCSSTLRAASRACVFSIWRSSGVRVFPDRCLSAMIAARNLR